MIWVLPIEANRATNCLGTYQFGVERVDPYLNRNMGCLIRELFSNRPLFSSNNPTRSQTGGLFQNYS
jgi:hypothetical protein